LARCGCASDQCACHFIAGENVIISGVGTRSNPYVIQSVAGEGEGGSGSGEGRLAGEIIAYGGSSAPAGWLICDGTLVPRGAFPALFDVIGTTYGAGDGATTFALPDLVGRFPLGESSSRPLGAKGGAEEIVIGLNHLPQHKHPMPHTHNMNHDHTINARTNGAAGANPDRVAAGSGTTDLDPDNTAVNNHTGNTGQPNNADTGNAGSASPDALINMPPYSAVTYLIKT
jgi:microcystin-dependent protein